MWDCGTCGCQNIADSVDPCPVCGTPRPEKNPVDAPADTPELEGNASGSAAEDLATEDPQVPADPWADVPPVAQGSAPTDEPEEPSA